VVYGRLASRCCSYGAIGYRIGADNKKLEAFVEKILVFANFVMWLKKEGIYEEVRKEVTESGYN
jgi:hypothetical protein